MGPADRPLVAFITVVLVCVSAYAAFRLIAWVLINGWKSMFGVLELRVEAITFDDVPQKCEASGCDHTKDGTEKDWDHAEVEAIAELVMAAGAEEETEEDVAHFVLWGAELQGHRGIEKHLRRMDRWSA